MPWYGRYIAEHALEDAVDSTIHMCGMQAVGEGSPCHDIFKVAPDLSCIDSIEANFCGGKRSWITSKSFIRDLAICAIYVLAHLMIPRAGRLMWF
jgi:hypothetical protein